MRQQQCISNIFSQSFDAFMRLLIFDLVQCTEDRTKQPTLLLVLAKFYLFLGKMMVEWKRPFLTRETAPKPMTNKKNVFFRDSGHNVCDSFHKRVLHTKRIFFFSFWLSCCFLFFFFIYFVFHCFIVSFLLWCCGFYQITAKDTQMILMGKSCWIQPIKL